MLLSLKKQYWYNVFSLVTSFYVIGMIFGVFKGASAQYYIILINEISILINGIVVGIKLTRKQQ